MRFESSLLLRRTREISQNIAQRIIYRAFHVRNLPTWKKLYQAPLKHWYDICVKTFSPFVWPLFHLHATLLAEINVPEKVPLRVYINDMY